MSEDIREVPITFDQAVLMFDAVQMMRTEARKTIDDNEDIIAPLKREAEATIDTCDAITNKLSVEFHFNTDED